MQVIEAATTTVDEIEQKRSLVAPTTTAKEKRLASAFANNALADVVQDFEKTLERSRTKSTSVERDSDREELEERRRTFDSRATTREKFFMEYGEYIIITTKGFYGRNKTMNFRFCRAKLFQGSRNWRSRRRGSSRAYCTGTQSLKLRQHRPC